MASLRCGLLVESAWNAFGWVLQEQHIINALLAADYSCCCQHYTAVGTV